MIGILKTINTRAAEKPEALAPDNVEQFAGSFILETNHRNVTGVVKENLGRNGVMLDAIFEFYFLSASVKSVAVNPYGMGVS